MTDHDHNPDPNANAARIVREATAGETPVPADLEAAWQAWSAGVQKMDERGMTLLRAAFEAGWEARTPTNGAAALGRLGGLKGGKARAAKLSDAKRKAIAKKAAAKRWAKKD